MAQEPLSWRVIEGPTPVLDAQENVIGHVRSVLADDQKDIFHGLAVDLKGAFTGAVEVPATRVARITGDAIYTDVAPEDVEKLESFEEEGWFDLEALGRIFKGRR